MKLLNAFVFSHSWPLDPFISSISHLCQVLQYSSSRYCFWFVFLHSLPLLPFLPLFVHVVLYQSCNVSWYYIIYILPPHFVQYCISIAIATTVFLLQWEVLHLLLHHWGLLLLLLYTILYHTIHCTVLRYHKERVLFSKVTLLYLYSTVWSLLCQNLFP